MRQSLPKADWRVIETGNGTSYLQAMGRECEVTIEERPSYCDRGRYLAKVHAMGALALAMDAADGWPRYYFDLDRAKLEVEAWLRQRNQWEPAAGSAREAATAEDARTSPLGKPSKRNWRRDLKGTPYPK